jgi:integrase/recombinase XerD
MTAEGMSPETVRQRLYLLRGLGKHPAEVTADDVIAVINSRDLSQHSRAAYITVYRTLFADLQRLGLVDGDPMVMIKTPRTARRRPRPLSDQQLAALESLPRDSREYAWTVLGAYGGLRVGEVCSITGQALQWRSHGPVLRITGKGGLTADIPAHPKVIKVLEPFDGDPRAIWPMWPQSMNRAWQKAAASVGLHGVVFHQLRHTFATRLTRSGVDLLVIAEVCRHASVATTQRYAAVADDAPFAAVAGL